MLKLRNFKSVYFLLLAFFLPIVSNASAYWLEIKGAGKLNKSVTVELIYGNIDEAGVRHRQTGAELNLAGDFRFKVITPSGETLQMEMNLKSDCWSFSFMPKYKGIYRIVGINDTHPVVDRSKIGGENILPIDYLCAEYAIEANQTFGKPQQFLDITAKKEGKLIFIKAFKDDKPTPDNTKLRVFNPQNWEKELIIKDGLASFMPTMSGMYIIRQDFSVKKAGEFKGVSYSAIRYRCNYCLFIIKNYN